jgi:TonB family protein
MSADVMDDNFINVPRPALIASALIHLAIPALIITVHILDQMGWLPFLKKHIQTKQVYQNFIQVDMVALPDELPNERNHIDVSLPIVDKARTAPDEPTATPQKNEMEIQGAEKDAKEKKAKAAKIAEEAEQKARKREKEQALKKLNEEAQREAALNAISPSDKGKLGRQKISGNILSKGAAMSGKLGAAKDQFESLVKQAILEHFNVYPWQKKRKLSTVVHIEMYPNGRVRQKQILKASADKTYDSAVMNAIDEAQPLPIPSDPSLVSDGITIEFRPE